MSIADYLMIDKLVKTCAACIAATFKHKHIRYVAAEWGIPDSDVEDFERDVKDRYPWIND